jgi:ABC-type transport system involved in multi-copper enzyme maturation permease subunit
MKGGPLAFVKGLVQIFANPVLYKELNIALRDRKVFILQTIYLSILSLALYLTIMESLYTNYPVSSAEAGKIIFYALFWIQLVLVTLIAPSLTCASISSEREKRTYELLIGTLLTPAEIISGKLISGVSYIFLLIISSLPITATVFFLGGVSPAQIIGGYLVIFASGFICCQIGEFFSVREQKTANATNQSYLVIIFFTICVLPALGAALSVQHGNLNSLFTYKTLSIPLWPFLVLNFIAFSGFIFAKTANHISHRAKNIFYLHGFFIMAYLLNLTVASAFVAEKKSGNEEIGIFLTLLMVAHLFMLGFFGRPSTFASQKEYSLFRGSLFSRPYFFPLFFSVTALIPYAFFAFEVKDISPLNESLFLNAFFILVIFVLARTLTRMVNEKLPFAFFYYLIAIVMSFLPYISFFRDLPPGTTSRLTSFHFLSPPVVIMSLWARNNYPISIDFFGGILPLSTFSVFVYLTILLLITLVFKIKFTPRRRE